MRRYHMGLIVIAGTFLFTCLSANSGRNDRTGTLTHENRPRKYLVHLPANADATTGLPLVLAFHGGGGTARGFARFTGFRECADRYGFIAVFPQGIENHWYDDAYATIAEGRFSPVDDLGFIRKLLAHLVLKYPVDPQRIYAAGMSNGGFFSFILGMKAADQFAAIAAVTAQLPRGSETALTPPAPIPILLMNGTDDPLVPYEGGQLRITLSPRRRKRGKIREVGPITSTRETIQYWLKHNEISGKPDVTQLPNTVQTDKTTVTRSEWTGSEGNEVLLYTINGGGHCWPGAAQYLPAGMIGRVNRDIDATEVIWDFFRQHKRVKDDR